MNKTGSGGAMSCTRGEMSQRPCCQDFCECLCKMADVGEMFGLADACRGLFSRAQSVADGARRQGEGTAEGTDTTSTGDSCSQDGTRLDHLIAELRTNMINLISLDVDVLRQFLHVYEEIEDLKLQRQFSIDGYDSASTYSYESGSSMESLQSVGRPLSGGFDSAMTYQSRGSRFLEVPRRGGSCSPKLGSPRLRRPLSNCSGTFLYSPSTTRGEPSRTENGLATVATEERLLSGTCRVAGKLNGSPPFESNHYNHRTTDNTIVRTVSHDSRMLSLADDRMQSSPTTVPSIEITSVQDSKDKSHDHNTHVVTDSLLTTKTSLQDTVVTSESPPQLPKKMRRGKTTVNQSNSESFHQELDEETARLIRTCEEYMLISDRTSQSTPVNNKLVPDLQTTKSYQNGYSQSWVGAKGNISLSKRRDVDVNVTTERTRPVCGMRSVIAPVHDHVGSACAHGEGDYMVMLPIIRVSGH
ncbi:serine-rich adhesin for platelets-like [Branchiostoma lanceolatum]|uniref:serine-rich adhesin for platelets-like n=1 Tax=Branchiostoma lanceolatum TaxID=7740 RepID=UPI0034529782